jgi:hypothetical protein
MTVLEQDTALTGGRGTPNAWSPASNGHNWTQVRGNQSLSFASSLLILTYTSSNTTGILYLGSTSVANQDITLNAQGSATSDIIGIAARIGDSTHYYQLELGNTLNTLEIRKNVAGVFTTLGSAAFTYAANTKYTFRFRLVGSTLKGKVWVAGGTEPDWMITCTDSSLSSGFMGVAGGPSTTTHTTSFDTFSATDALLQADTQTRVQFKIQAPGTTRARVVFSTRTPATSEAQSRYPIRSTGLSPSRSVFKVRGPAGEQTRARFIISLPQVVLAPLSLAFSLSQDITEAFSTFQSLMASLSTVQAITLAFGSTMPQPNSTITSTATVKDASGTLLSNLSSVSVIITFPDGSSSSIVGFGSGEVVNLGSGEYKIQYITKMPGLIREEWSVLASDGTTKADYVNLVPVSY